MPVNAYAAYEDAAPNRLTRITDSATTHAGWVAASGETIHPTIINGVSDNADPTWYFDVDNSAIVEDPVRSSAQVRTDKRQAIHDHIARIGDEPPRVTRGADETSDIGTIHNILQKIYAAAAIDSNIDSTAIYDALEGIVKDLDGRRLYAQLVTNSGLKAQWNAYTTEDGASASVTAGANASTGAPEAKSVIPAVAASVWMDANWEAVYL